MTPVRTLLVGLGGYGNGYLNAALDSAGELGIDLAGAVDPDPRGCERIEELRERVGTIHATLEEFYASGSADLVVISAPIHLHAPFTITAVEHGSHVLCEKPVAATVADAHAMDEAARKAGVTVSVGYQWSFSEAIGSIRADAAAGRFGEPIDLRTLVFWPRPRAYYRRNTWAGALRAPDGSLVLDSPVNNATAHYLHNALFILGEGGEPTAVTAELSRANPIESFDTAAIRVETGSGAPVLFLTSHAVPSRVGPVISYRFSEAHLVCEVPGTFRARFNDGTVVDYGSPELHHDGKLARAAAAVRDGLPPACPISEATRLTRVVEALHREVAIVPRPSELLREEHDLIWVDRLQEELTESFATGLLPSELGIPDAPPARRVSIGSR